MLPEGKHAVIRKDSYEVPAIFQMMAREGKVEEQMMYKDVYKRQVCVLAAAFRVGRRNRICTREDPDVCFFTV